MQASSLSLHQLKAAQWFREGGTNRSRVVRAFRVTSEAAVMTIIEAIPGFQNAYFAISRWFGSSKGGKPPPPP